jgi:hypothetical protein
LEGPVRIVEDELRESEKISCRVRFFIRLIGTQQKPLNSVFT